jgi:hypothetical protein
MDFPRRIGKHFENIKLFSLRVLRALEEPAFFPDLLPLILHPLRIISPDHSFLLNLPVGKIPQSSPGCKVKENPSWTRRELGLPAT